MGHRVAAVSTTAASALSGLVQHSTSKPRHKLLGEAQSSDRCPLNQATEQLNN